MSHIQLISPEEWLIIWKDDLDLFDSTNYPKFEPIITRIVNNLKDPNNSLKNKIKLKLSINDQNCERIEKSNLFENEQVTRENLYFLAIEAME